MFLFLVLQLNKKVGDLVNEFVWYFLIECILKGVWLKGCLNELYFGSLMVLVCQYFIMFLVLLCKLFILERDLLEEIVESFFQMVVNLVVELLKQGVVCNVWYLNFVEMEFFIGYQVIQKVLSIILVQEFLFVFIVVYFKVLVQGIILIDNQRKFFFWRYYFVNSVIFCVLDL